MIAGHAERYARAVHSGISATDHDSELHAELRETTQLGSDSLNSGPMNAAVGLACQRLAGELQQQTGCRDQG